MKTIAIIHQKGGTGKTTVALDVGVSAFLENKTVVILDLDPQASATKWGDRRQKEEPFIIATPVSRLQNMKQTAIDQGVNLLLIDTPPKSEQTTLMAAKAADLIIIPCKPEVFDSEGLDDLLQVLRLSGDKPTFVILTHVKNKSRFKNGSDAITNQTGLSVAPWFYGDRVAWGDGAILGQSVQEYQPNGEAAEESKQIYDYICKIMDNKVCGQ